MRYSLVDPHAYVDANMQGFINVLEGCRHNGCRHLRLCVVVVGLWRQHQAAVLASRDNVDHPISLYAASKKANELMAHSYAHLFRAAGDRACASSRSTGRGAGRTWRCGFSPRRSSKGEPITLFNHGKMRRDFTYVDDVVEVGRRGWSTRPAAPDPAWSGDAPDPATQRRALAHLQHRQQQRRSRCCTWSSCWKRRLGRKAQARTAADAAGRRAGDLCRCRRPDARCRVSVPRRRSRTGSHVSSSGIAIHGA